MSFLESFDQSIQDGPIGRFFEMKERKTTVRAELGGALCTFMSMVRQACVMSCLVASKAHDNIALYFELEYPYLPFFFLF